MWSITWYSSIPKLTSFLITSISSIYFRTFLNLGISFWLSGHSWLFSFYILLLFWFFNRLFLNLQKVETIPSLVLIQLLVVNTNIVNFIPRQTPLPIMNLCSRHLKIEIIGLFWNYLILGYNLIIRFLCGHFPEFVKLLKFSLKVSLKQLLPNRFLFRFHTCSIITVIMRFITIQT